MSPGWAWWYQSLGEVLPDPESINLTKTERDISLGEVDLENLSGFGDEVGETKHADPEKIKTLFPEVPSTRERKNLAVSRISGQNEEESPVVVLD
eukprot:6492419-Amphidinium_carterae.2